MAEGGPSTTERRGQAREWIEHMLEERRQLFSLLLEVSSRNPVQPDRELLAEFCQLLVDYIAAGHFGLYQRIIEGTERRRKVLDLAARIYARIDETTRTSLEFNEKYEPEKTLRANPFYSDLSRLGESLTSRIEFEDELIRTLQDESGIVAG